MITPLLLFSLEDRYNTNEMFFCAMLGETHSKNKNKKQLRHEITDLENFLIFDT